MLSWFRKEKPSAEILNRYLKPLAELQVQFQKGWTSYVEIVHSPNVPFYIERKPQIYWVLLSDNTNGEFPDWMK